MANGALRALIATLTASGVPGTYAAYAAVPDQQCSCYLTNATTANYFSHHEFFDFRHLSQYVASPEPFADADSSAYAPPTSDFFTLSNWTSLWDAQTWNNSDQLGNPGRTGSDASILMVNSRNNVYIDHERVGTATTNGSAVFFANNSTVPPSTNNTYLTLRTLRQDGFQSAAEVVTVSTGFQYVSMRMLARTLGPSGAITSMFTYRRPPANSTSTALQESDMEIRTCDPPSYVQFTNQPGQLPNDGGDNPLATHNYSMPTGLQWSDWAVWRLDWNPGSSTWYVNGQLASRIAYQTPRDPSMLIFNSWSDGGSWSGNMTDAGAVVLQIQWIEMVFNNTDPSYQVLDSKCKVICSIDETETTGSPVMLSNNTGKSGLWSGRFLRQCFFCARPISSTNLTNFCRAVNSEESKFQQDVDIGGKDVYSGFE
jgi:hypothetical protein